MKNFIQDGDTLTVPAPYALVSGAGCLVGSLFGVASADALITAEVEIKTTGVFDFPKAATQAWTVGVRVYWDDAAKNVTTNAAAGVNKLIGVAALAVAGGAGDLVGRVRLTAGMTL